MKAELRKSPEKNLFVKADHRATYGIVRKVLEEINKAGVENVMLGTEELKAE